MLTTMKELLWEAEKNHRGIGGFNVGNMEMVLGAVRAAEKEDTPIILQIAQKRLETSPLELLGPMMVEAAKKSRVKMAVHLDHGLTKEVIRQALEYGFTSVMFDGSSLDLKENISRSREIKELADHYGASFEAELGVVGGNEGNGEKAVSYTDPSHAALFYEKVRMDALAIAIGNAHGHYQAEPELKFLILEEIHRRIPIPLVLHGGSGISFQEFRRCIRSGIRKINIGTASFDALKNSQERYLKEHSKGNFFEMSAAGAEGVEKNIRRHIQVFHNQIIEDEESKEELPCLSY